MIITLEDLNKAKTERGGFKKRQVQLGQRLTGSKKWLNAMVGLEVTEAEWKRFVSYGGKKRKDKKKPVNKMTVKRDDFWKPEERDIPKLKGKKTRRQKVGYLGKEFYRTKEWLQLRVRVLEKYECKCMMCGQSPKEHGVVIHVDHIKPRSKYPELALEFNNLQLLCEDCNVGKSNKYETDWRPDDVLDIAHLKTIEHLI